MYLSPNPEQWSNHVTGLKPLVVDQPILIAAIDERLKPPSVSKQQRRWENEEAKRKKQEERRRAKNRAKWIAFWREVANRPEVAFSTDRSLNTAWNLWKAMSHDGENSRASGWEPSLHRGTIRKGNGRSLAAHSHDHLAPSPSHPSERKTGKRAPRISEPLAARTRRALRGG